MTALFTPRERREGLDAQLQELARDVFAFASDRQVGPISTDLLTRQRLLVADIGRVGALADQVISGSGGARCSRHDH